MKTACVAFDLGGVLVDVDHERMWDRLGVRDEDAIFAHGDHDLVSTGRIDGATFIARCAARLGLPAERVRDAWCAVVRPSPETAALLLDHPRACAWSNTDPLHIETLAAVLRPLLSPAQRALSYELGEVKPAAAFFSHAIERAGCPAEEIVFLDDREENVEAARRFGVRAFVVRGVGEARAILTAHG